MTQNIRYISNIFLFRFHSFALQFSTQELANCFQQVPYALMISHLFCERGLLLQYGLYECLFCALCQSELSCILQPVFSHFSLFLKTINLS